ncbi:MAG TPA: hypothetical protein VK112_05500 [Fodinibius sp.]|nr:hypothetical protein [Fodinibius sp.]
MTENELEHLGLDWFAEIGWQTAMGPIHCLLPYSINPWNKEGGRLYWVCFFFKAPPCDGEFPSEGGVGVGQK